MSVACMQVPIIAPVKQKKLEVNEQASLPTYYSSEFLGGLMTNPELVRNVAVIGQLHHGKSLVRPSSMPCDVCVPRMPFIVMSVCPACPSVSRAGAPPHWSLVGHAMAQRAADMPCLGGAAAGLL